MDEIPEGWLKAAAAAVREGQELIHEPWRHVWSDPDCGTMLSLYNSTEFYWTHQPIRFAHPETVVEPASPLWGP